MALLLIYDHDNHHANPLKDIIGCYKRGMIVEVLDDSRHDGDLSKNPIMPPWILVRINGVSKEQVLKYGRQRISDIPDAEGNLPIIGRRLYRVLVDTLPSAIYNQIVSKRYIEVSLSQVRNYIQNIKDGTTGG